MYPMYSASVLHDIIFVRIALNLQFHKVIPKSLLVRAFHLFDADCFNILVVF